MTCIVGIEHEGKVWMGGDTAGVSDDFTIEARRDVKVFTNGEFIMCFTSSFRMGQLLRYAFDPPERSQKTEDDMEYLVVDVMDAIRELFKEKGYMGKDEDRESGGTWLMGYRGHLYTIYDDFQVASVTDGYTACGCGVDLAKGSLHTTSNLKMSPETRVKLALDAASWHSAGVRPPYTILSL